MVQSKSKSKTVVLHVQERKGMPWWAKGLVALTLLSFVVHIVTPTSDRSPSVPPAPVRVVPCLEEDGSTPGQAFPCVWNAESYGNHRGHSYVLTQPL